MKAAPAGEQVARAVVAGVIGGGWGIVLRVAAISATTATTGIFPVGKLVGVCTSSKARARHAPGGQR